MDELARTITERFDVEVHSIQRLAGGACQELFRVDTSSGRLVLRSDAPSSLPGSIGRKQEHAVVAAAVANGVPTPAVRWLSEDLVREGAWSYFMDWLEGEAIGARVLRHPALAEARAALPGQLAQALAAVHAVDAELPLEPVGDPAGHALGQLRHMLDRLPWPRPGLELAWRWCAENRPRDRPITLCHGDFRVGNFMVGPQGLVGLLDWEFARWGDPVDDIAWLCVRDWRFGQVDKPAGGLTSREAFCQAYSAASGREVDPGVLHFWEVMGNLRWGGAAVMQGPRYRTTGDLEMLAIPRRVAEMEYEALRLIEVGP